MKGYKIKITKAALDSYWYASLIGYEFWAEERINLAGEREYAIVVESINKYSLPTLSSTGKWVGENDCEVLREAYIKIESVTTTTVVEI
jgi:hypothetical protein